MIVGIHSRDNDLVVNAVRGKQLTNFRVSGKEDAIKITPPIILTLEYAVEFIADDELVEITPKSIRIRKRHLKEHERKRASREAGLTLTHRQAVALMVAVTLMWSIAGIVTRHLDGARSFELTFWRSLFNALALLLMLGWMRGPARLWRTLRDGGRALWISGLCWCVMYTAFMVAISLTEVANVLVTMSIAPLLTAIAARVALGHRLAPRTWAAIVVAGAGIAWMYGAELDGSDPRHLVGTAVALCVPIAAAINWTLLQHIHHADDERRAGRHAGARCCWAPCCRPRRRCPCRCPLPPRRMTWRCSACWAWCSWRFPACWPCAWRGC